MTTLPHEPAAIRRERPQWAELLKIREMWASLAITMMWVAVSVDAAFGPDVVSSNGAGTQTTTIPSAVFVALFAFLATAALAKVAFKDDSR